MLISIDNIKLIKDIEPITKNKIIEIKINNSIGNIILEKEKLDKNEKLKILNNITLKADLTETKYKGYSFSRKDTYDNDQL